jgi:hypothetical protein
LHIAFDLNPTVRQRKIRTRASKMRNRLNL